MQTEQAYICNSRIQELEEFKKPCHFVFYSIGYTIIQCILVSSVYFYKYNILNTIWFAFSLINIIFIQIYYCEIFEYPYFGLLGHTKIPLLALSSIAADTILCIPFYFHISCIILIHIVAIGICTSIYKTILCEKKTITSLEFYHKCFIYIFFVIHYPRYYIIHSNLVLYTLQLFCLIKF